MNTRVVTQFIRCIPFFMVLATVFVIRPELERGVVSGKYFWFYLSMGIVTILSTIMIIKHFIRITLSDCLILLFGMSMLSISYWINGSESITKHILLLLVITLYFYFRMQFQLFKSSIYWLSLFLIITGLIEFVWGMRQLYGFDHSQHSNFKLTGSFFNPGPYACYLSIIAPVAFYYILQDWNCTKMKLRFKFWPIYLRWGIAVLTFAGVILVLPASMSRASWLACFGGCGLVLLFYMKEYRIVKKYYQTHKKLCLGILILFIFLSAIGCLGIYYLKKDSADGRALIWKTSIQTILHYPMGVGIGNFSGSYGDAQAAYFASGKGSEQEKYVAGNPEYAFNEYLQICVEQGLFSFLLYMVIIIYSLYIGIKRKKIAPTASLIALLIISAMSYPFSVLPFLIVFVFLLAWIHSGKRGVLIKPLFTSGIAGFSLVVVLLCLYNRYPTYQAYKKWNKYTLLYHSGLYMDAAKMYELIYPLLSDQLTFLFEYAQCLSKNEMYAESNQVLEKAIRISCDPMLYNIIGKNYQALKQYDKAAQCFEKSSHIIPNRIYPYYLKALLFIETGEMERAKVAAQIVLTKEPKVQSTAIREMREKMDKLINSDLE